MENDATLLLRHQGKVLDEVATLRSLFKGFCAARSIPSTVYDVDNMSVSDLIRAVNVVKAIRS